MFARHHQGRVTGLLAVIAMVTSGMLTAPTANAAPASPTVDLPSNSASGGHGLKGEYYTTTGSNWDFGELKGTIVDPNIDMANFVGELSALTGQTEQVAVRWTGQLDVEVAEDYTFYWKGDNGVRISIDGNLVIDHWVNDWEIEYHSDPVTLTAGMHDVKIEYFQATGGANAHVSWKSASTPKQVIPPSAFYLPDGFEQAAGSASIPASGDQIVVDFDDDLLAWPASMNDHLRLLVGGQSWPAADVAIDPSDDSKVIVSLPGSVIKDSWVNISYDGSGGASTTAGALPAFSYNPDNASTYYMQTPWAQDVDSADPLPEYPRPQLTRDRWRSLNGVWQFEASTEGATVVPGQDLTGQIVVPYPMESALSGVQQHHDYSVYRRTFTTPADWSIGTSNRLMLNFGAVDYAATVYVNGQQVAHHEGGYLSWSADVTDALTTSGPQELIVAVTDTTDPANPHGKQTANPGGIFYTPTSGIWQTVWLEPVPMVAIDTLDMVPDVDAGTLTVTANSASSADGDVTVTVSSDGQQVAEATGSANEPIVVSIPDAHLWSPDDPFLYDVSAQLADGDVNDTVGSYMGMRSIEIAEVGGVNKVKLNGQSTFLLATLDQGFWPDGIYTAPTDEALKWDIQETKDLGFNTIRKHIKVEPARWYYWADKLGMMVWQDMPSGDNPPDARQNFRDVLHAEINQLISVPSIIGWIPFNEGWGEWDRADTGEIADSVKAQDPSRLVDAHSGVNCCASKGDSGAGDMIDWHMYTGPGHPAPDADRAAMDGEHGGFSMSVIGHMWPGGSVNPYGGVANSTELTAAYVKNTEKLIPWAQCDLSGSVYTQITDVENELNGFWTYDRQISKMDRAQVRAVNERVVAAGAAAGAPVDEGVDTPGLEGVGWWPMDDGAGDVAEDVSGNGNHGTLHGDATWVDGRSGSAVQLDGSGDYIDAGTPAIDTTASYSVSAWAKLDSLGHFATVVSADGDENSAFFLQYSDADKRFAFSFAQTRALADSIGQPVPGTWYHLTGVRDAAANSLTIYVDGEKAGSAVSCTQDVGTGDVVVGRGKWEGKPVDYWPGAIYSVHVYDRALSAEEVADLYTAEPDVPQVESTTSLELSSDVAAPSEAVQATATIKAPGALIGGSVTFTVDGTDVTPVPVGDDGTVQVTLPKFKPGTHDVAAAYSGLGRVTGSEAPPATLEVRFVDVAVGSVFYDDILWLADIGITLGDANGDFLPRKHVARQEMAAFLYRASHDGADAGECTEASPFADVDKSNPFCGAIEWLKAAGITNGYGDGKYRPKNSVARQEMAAFLYRASHDGAHAKSCTTAPFIDVPATNQFCGVIAWLAQNEISVGDTDGRFGPRVDTLRQEMAAFIHRWYAIA